MSAGLRIAAGEHLHTPNEVTSFSLSYADHFVVGEEISSIVSSTVIVDGATGTDIVIDTVQDVVDLVNVTISAGEDNGVYYVVVTITSNLGQTIEGAVEVVVQNAVEV